MVDVYLKEMGKCPRCGGELSSKSGQMACGGCHQRFPVVDDLLWLVKHPDEALADWRIKSDRYVSGLEHDFQSLSQPQSSQPSKVTQERLRLLAQGIEFNVKAFKDLLRSIHPQKSVSLEIHNAIKSQVPLSQKLMGYESNIFRDWVWGEQECSQMLELCRNLQGDRPWGHVLVLGAGAGRLAYDLSFEPGAEHVVALDNNPLLLQLGQRLSRGEEISLFEFPLAPKSLKEVAVRQTLKAPKKAPENLHFILADGMNPPFKLESFSTVITPWFIDVIPQDLTPMAQKINRLLRPQGRWLNLGPYGFLNADLAHQYSLEEVIERISEAGFNQISSQQVEVDYLKSPLSCHHRRERLLTFSAERGELASDAPEFKVYPTWVEDLALPVPRLEAFERYRGATVIQSQALGLIDGSRSIQVMAEQFAQVHGLSKDTAQAALVTLLRQLLEDSGTVSSWNQ